MLLYPIKEWRQHPEKFTGRPKLPKYKPKKSGRFLLIYDKQALSKRALKRGMIAPSGLGIEIPTKQAVVKQARIVPGLGFYVVETVYERAQGPSSGNPNWYASIDLGVDNLAAITSNKEDFAPRLVNGRPIKSINQHYNKTRAELQQKLVLSVINAKRPQLRKKRERKAFPGREANR